MKNNNESEKNKNKNENEKENKNENENKNEFMNSTWPRGARGGQLSLIGLEVQ